MLVQIDQSIHDEELLLPIVLKHPQEAPYEIREGDWLLGVGFLEVEEETLEEGE